jgi:hypothetical protein
MKNAPSHTPAVFSSAWFDAAFYPAKNVPIQIRALAERLCRTFTIRGICDPMYITNIVAFELGAGTGRSEFHQVTTPLSVSAEAVTRLVKRLMFAYLSSITASEAELCAIFTEELCPKFEGPVT